MTESFFSIGYFADTVGLLMLTRKPSALREITKMQKKVKQEVTSANVDENEGNSSPPLGQDE